MSAMSLEICSVAPLAWAARFFTSLATTANPLPASPARADSIVALGASKLICAVMLLIRSTIPPIDWAAALRRWVDWSAVSTRSTALSAVSFDLTMVSAISFTEELSSSAPAATLSTICLTLLALLSSNDLIGDISGEFDDLKGLSAQVEDRIVGCLDPHLFAVLPDALELCRLKFTAIEGSPELLILGAVLLDSINENAVVFAADLFECVAHCAQEVFIGSDGVPSRLNSITACDFPIASLQTANYVAQIEPGPRQKRPGRQCV